MIIELLMLDLSRQPCLYLSKSLGIIYLEKFFIENGLCNFFVRATSSDCRVRHGDLVVED